MPSEPGTLPRVFTLSNNAPNQVNDLRADLGAAQNRFESAISNIESTTTNISAARSRIVDADYARQVSNC